MTNISTSALTTKQARLGLSSLIQHELITPYVPMRSSRTSDLVCQFKATILVTPEGLVRTTCPQALPFVHSQYCIPAETTAAQVLSAPSVVKISPVKQLSEVQVEFGNRRVEVSHYFTTFHILFTLCFIERGCRDGVKCHTLLYIYKKLPFMNHA